MARNHAGANASQNHVPENRARVTNRRPTMRAVDRWVHAAFLERFRGFEFFPFRRRVSARPLAG